MPAAEKNSGSLWATWTKMPVGDRGVIYWKWIVPDKSATTSVCYFSSWFANSLSTPDTVDTAVVWDGVRWKNQKISW